MKRAESTKLLESIANCVGEKQYFQKIARLALLPAQDIRLAFTWLRIAFVEMRAKFEAFLNYFEIFWLNTVTPEVFSVYGLENRTNNYIESYHRKLNRVMGPHPTIWQFSGKL